MCSYDLFIGYDGIQEFVPAMLDLIQSKLAGPHENSSDKNVPKLEKASAFHPPLICESATDNCDKPVPKADLQCKKSEFAEECFRLSNGSPAIPQLCNDAANCFEPFAVCRAAGNGLKSHRGSDASNGAAQTFESMSVTCQAASQVVVVNNDPSAGFM